MSGKPSPYDLPGMHRMMKTKRIQNRQILGHEVDFEVPVHDRCSACGGSGEVDAPPNFIQLCSSPAGMFALAIDGSVWVYCRTPNDGWKPVSMNRLSGD